MKKLLLLATLAILSIGVPAQRVTSPGGSSGGGGAGLTGVTNDTNITGSIAGTVLTLGWTGALAKARQNAFTAYIDQTNTFSLAQTFSLAPTVSAFGIGVVKSDASGLLSSDALSFADLPVRTIATTNGLQGGGDLSADRNYAHLRQFVADHD